MQVLIKKPGITFADCLWSQLHCSRDVVPQAVYPAFHTHYCRCVCRSEAAALLGRPSCTAQEAALALGPHCKIVLVTDGAHGSCISAMGQLHSIPPCWTSNTPVDTCGAGDGYAAGAMYGFLCGYDLTNIGRAGARVASAVILRQGAATTQDEALKLVQTLPETANGTHILQTGLPSVSQMQKQTQTQCL